MKKKFSIHDIARELKVSATTISFVLNGTAEGKKVSEPVRKKVLDYVKSIGYKPNPIAQSLRTGKSKIIGMLVEDISDPFFSGIGRIIEDNLYEHGYKIFHSSTDNNTARAKDLLRIFRERQVDGYIIAPSPGIESEIRYILNDAKPVVLFDRFFPDVDTTNIIIDNEGGAYNAVMHLVENGFFEVAFITLNSEQNQMISRLQGYLKAINENNLDKYVLKVAYKTRSEELTQLIRSFIDNNKKINAVLFATNYLAIAGLEALKDLNRKIPGDIAVISFDDNSHFSLFSPSVTAVAQPVEEISKKVIEHLMLCINDENNKTKNITIRLPTKLVIRESSLRRNGIEN